MSDGWIVLLVLIVMLGVVLVTSIITGGAERIAKYKADRKAGLPK